MTATPRYVVRRRTDGAPAAQLYDLPAQGMVGLHVGDPDLVRLLIEAGVLIPRRPPFLDAAEHGGVHGGYAPRPQINWFLVPPIEEAASALEAALAGSGGYDVAAEPAPA